VLGYKKNKIKTVTKQRFKNNLKKVRKKTKETQGMVDTYS